LSTHDLSNHAQDAMSDGGWDAHNQHNGLPRGMTSESSPHHLVPSGEHFSRDTLLEKEWKDRFPHAHVGGFRNEHHVPVIFVTDLEVS